MRLARIPAKFTFLTDGLSRTVKVGKRTIELKLTTPRNLGLKQESKACPVEGSLFRTRMDAENPQADC